MFGRVASLVLGGELKNNVKQCFISIHRCVCVCVRVAGWLGQFTYVCFYVCVYVRMHVCTHVCMYACVHVYVCNVADVMQCMYVCRYMYVWSVQILDYVCARTCYVPIHLPSPSVLVYAACACRITYTHTYIWTCSCSLSIIHSCMLG